MARRLRPPHRAPGRTPTEACALAGAAGTAAVLTMGTELCRRADVLRIYRQIKAGQAEAPAVASG